jgi:Phasin protein
MAQAKETQRRVMNATAAMGAMPPIMQNPIITIIAEMSGSFLESVATAQKDWMDFVHRRIKEDVAVSRKLMRCQSLPEMHQIYSEYLETAFEQYQRQSEKLVERGESMAQHLAQTTEAAANEGARARHHSPWSPLVSYVGNRGDATRASHSRKQSKKTRRTAQRTSSLTAVLVVGPRTPVRSAEGHVFLPEGEPKVVERLSKGSA